MVTDAARPAAAQVARPLDPVEVLFSSQALGPLTLKNRLVMAPMGTCLDAGGRITEDTIAYYVRRARGGVGTITVEGCLVSPDTVGPEPGIHNRHFLDGLSRLVEALQPYDVTVGVQLMHPGRQVVDGPRVAPSPIPLNAAAPVPHALSVTEIEQIIEDYGRATTIAQDAGFDFVEVHGAHGYLPSNFLSPAWNERDDDYGGSAERRARFCLEVVEAMRAACADRLPIVWRLNGNDAAEGGLQLAEATKVSRRLVDAGVAALSVSAGTWHSLHVTIAPMSTPRGHLLELARTIRAAANVPVMAVGRLDDPALAAHAVTQGAADLVVLGRALLAEPDWPAKVRARDELGRRPCIACNACVDLVGRGERARCAVNPELGREREWRVEPTAAPRHVMVVGAGPAGMEAARIARLRGHRVSLWERDDRLGGKLEVAGLAPSKHEVLRYRDHQRALLPKLGVEIHLGREVTPRVVRAVAPDVVVVATGADPLVPPLPGITGAGVFDAQEVLRGDVQMKADARLVIVGGSATGCETAETMLGDAGSITIVEMQGAIGTGIEAITRRHLLRTLRSGGVTVRKHTRVVAIGDGEIEVEGPDGRTGTIPFDVVALAIGWRPRGAKLAAELPGIEVVVLGDALEPGDFVSAVNAGADVGLAV